MKTRVNQHQQESNEPELASANAREPRQSANLAARMGRWSAQHRKGLFGSFAFVFVAFALGIMSGTKQIDPDLRRRGLRTCRQDSRCRLQAARRRERAHPEPCARRQGSGVHGCDRGRRRESLEGRGGQERPLTARREQSGQFSGNGHAALVEFDIRGDSEDATAKIDPVIAAVSDTQKAHPQLFIGSFGVSSDKEIDAAFMDDLKKAGILSLP